MSIKLCQAAGSVVTPIDDARLYSWIANRTVGIVSGCVVTSAGTNQLSITAGWGICQGHVFVISAETISAAVASSGTMLGRLLIHINTSDSTTPVKFVTQAASTLPSLTQEAIDGSGSIYEIPLATYSVGTISISNLVDVATRLSGVLQAIGAATAAQGAKADALKSGAVFAAAETATGELWENASGNKYPVYRRVYHNVPVSDTANATINTTTGLASSYVRTMLGLGAKSYMARSNGAHVPTNIYNPASTAWGGNNMVSLTIDSGTSTWAFQTVSAGAETGRTCELVVEYTKTSDSAVT